MVVSNWIKQDDGEGNTYYLNLQTNESQWERPDDYEEPPADLAPENSWTELNDGQGNKYYYNTVTEESSWEKPPQLDGADATSEYPKWSKMYDPASEAYYYYNNETGDTQWDVPSDYEEPKKGEPLNLPPSISAVLKIQSAFRAKKKRV